MPDAFLFKGCTIDPHYIFEMLVRYCHIRTYFVNAVVLLLVESNDFVYGLGERMSETLEPELVALC